MNVDLGPGQCECLVYGVTATVDECGKEPGYTGEVEVEDDAAGGDIPDVHEGGDGELTAPAKGQRDGAQVGEHCVAAVLAGVETLVRVAPYALVTVGTLWFTEDVHKQGLKYMKIAK